MRLDEVGLCPADSNVQTNKATPENRKGWKMNQLRLDPSSIEFNGDKRGSSTV